MKIFLKKMIINIYLKKWLISQYKMEFNKESNKESIEISLELLKNIRNLIEVTNTRINWKIEELLPVGLIIKQIDEILNLPIKDS